MSSGFIFVYGTLRKHSANPMHNVLAQNCEYLSDAYMQGKLYEVRGYPGVIESANEKDKVIGEVYQIKNNGYERVLSVLDTYEGCTAAFPAPNEYIRKKLPVSLATGRTVSAWVYLFNHDVTNLQQIESGDYLTFIKPSELE